MPSLNRQAGIIGLALAIAALTWRMPFGLTPALAVLAALMLDEAPRPWRRAAASVGALLLVMSLVVTFDRLLG